ncbi:MAG: hypothetical protein MZV64_23215 [Ignavibacteriales bacterium]|nr:hypothetical protein [Ignavibacteriales bacterium]
MPVCIRSMPTTRPPRHCKGMSSWLRGARPRSNRDRRPTYTGLSATGANSALYQRYAGQNAGRHEI